MSSERAGAPTHGTLNREKAREVLRSARHARDHDPERALDALEACVVPDPRIRALEENIRNEQEQLWDDLDKALRRAINGIWSMECGSYAYRIVQSARLVGPTHHDSVQWPLAAGDVYAAVLTAGGIDVPEITEAEWAAVEEHMGKYGLRADLLQQFAATRAAILDPREAAGIRGER